MARKARQRISYVLPLANSPGGHRLGVNGLAVDSDQSILYSGGRDGVICAWNLNLDLHAHKVDTNKVDTHSSSPPEDTSSNSNSRRARCYTFRSQVQAHTHWVNDVILTHSNAALVSASSDLTVKVWRPQAEDNQSSATIGLHDDYVKCLATPGTHADWVASGGLDHKIRVWDLHGNGERLQIDAGEDDNSAKGSVYALSVRGSIMASGGPESVVRLWDPKSGKRITKLVGHTDNVRDILINQDGDTIMTASSDQTVKVWSMTAGRCMYTLTMHSDSVWSLYSDHPQLSIFYSSDRAGLIAKTDVRGSADMDDGLSLALAQEQGGVNKVVVAGEYFWTATSSSSINRWNDVDTGREIQIPDSPRYHRGSSLGVRSKTASTAIKYGSPEVNGEAEEKIPFDCILRVSNRATLPTSKFRELEGASTLSGEGARKPSEAFLESDLGVIVPFHSLPEETIEGQHGLIKHVLLNDRKRVLTLDTAGEVMMWDLLKCVPIQSFGKRHLEDVMPEVNTTESVANWCAVDTRTGRLACVLEENYCFDAEMYADEADVEEPIQFRDDQRINLGKWVLRYLFDNLINEEIKQDDIFRTNLVAHTQQSNGLRRENAPLSIQLPKSPNYGWERNQGGNETVITPRPANGNIHAAMTPGLAIGVATPAAVALNHGTQAQNHLPSTAEEGTDLDERLSHQGQPRTSNDRSADYFSSNPTLFGQHDNDSKGATTPGGQAEGLMHEPNEAEREEKPKESGSLFGKKFRMNFPRKLGRSSVEVKPAVVDEKAEESDKSSEREDRIIEDNLLGVIQKLRTDYQEQLESTITEPLEQGIHPSLPSETPVLNIPPSTTIIIQEDRPDSGGVVDLYRGHVSSVGRDSDLIERTAPMWLGDLLLLNQIPVKETVKVSFVLQPYQDLLPSIASADGNARLNANRMLRAKKILSYVAERIEPQSQYPDPKALKPEEYLDLYCQNQPVPLNMTLATLRVHVWRTGGDVMLYYKSNGRRPELGQETPVNIPFEASAGSEYSMPRI